MQIMKRSGFIGFALIFFVSSLNAQKQTVPVPVFRVDVDTVFVKVGVTDPLNRYVTNLNKDCFRIYEDKILQTISYFGEQSAPITVGLLFDISASMGFEGNIQINKSRVARFLKKINPKDEFFLITFNQNVTTVESFTDDSANLLNDIGPVKAGGDTAIYDAVYSGLEKVKQGKNEKKALIVFSDGEENSSRNNRKQLLESLTESDVPVYCVGLQGPNGYGDGVLKDIARITGGRSFAPSLRLDQSAIDFVLSELRNNYIVGYAPSNKSRNGKWRKIKIQLEAPPGFPPLKIQAREGYYAPRH
jgi:Ca-activated chloride channel homolog